MSSAWPRHTPSGSVLRGGTQTREWASDSRPSSQWCWQLLLQKGKNRKSQWPRLRYWRKHAENSTARGVPILTAGTAMSAVFAGETTQPAGVPLALPRVQGPRKQPRRATHTNSTGSNNLSRLRREQQLVPLPLINNLLGPLLWGACIVD